MAGYTRQSAASIVTDEDILAAPLNAEFNQLESAFNGTTGHSHDGTTGNGPQIDLTTSVTGELPTANVANNAITFAKIQEIADYKILGNVSGGTTEVAEVDLLDEDDMSSDSATSLATQQSIKAYADTMLPLTGGAMTGAIAMGTNKITGTGDPTAAQDVATKNYVDSKDAVTKAYADANFVLTTGGSMTGALAMGSNKITGLGTPTATADAATKNYVDTVAVLGGDPSNVNVTGGNINGLTTLSLSGSDITKIKAFSSLMGVM